MLGLFRSNIGRYITRLLLFPTNENIQSHGDVYPIIRHLLPTINDNHVKTHGEYLIFLLQFINLNTYQYVTKMARKHILLIQTIDITRK